MLERQLEQGKITGDFKGIHSYHDPEEGLVTISPDPQITWKPNSFATFTREMTPEEKEKYCQIEMEFEEPKEKDETLEESIDDDAATILDQIDYEHYDPGTFVPDDEENDEPKEEEVPESEAGFSDGAITEEVEPTPAESKWHPHYNKRFERRNGKTIEIDIPYSEKIHEPVTQEINLGVQIENENEELRTEEDALLDFTYTIEKCESIKYPWNILETLSGESRIYERFRTKEEAESFMRDFIEEKKPFESNPNARYQLERVFGAWKVRDFGAPESFSKINPRFVQAKCTYHEAKELCDELNSEPEEVDQVPDSIEDQKVISDTENYKIVENPDGSLRTIRKNGKGEN